MHKRLLRQHIQRSRLGDPAVAAPDPEDLRLALARAGDQVLGDGEDGVAALRGAVHLGEHVAVRCGAVCRVRVSCVVCGVPGCAWWRGRLREEAGGLVVSEEKRRASRGVSGWMSDGTREDFQQPCIPGVGIRYRERRVYTMTSTGTREEGERLEEERREEEKSRYYRLSPSLPGVFLSSWSLLVSGTPLVRRTQLTTNNQATFSGVGAGSEGFGPLSLVRDDG